MDKTGACQGEILELLVCPMEKTVLVGTIRDSKGGSAQQVFIYHPDSIKSIGRAPVLQLFSPSSLPPFVAITRSKRDLLLVYEKDKEPKPKSGGKTPVDLSELPWPYRSSSQLKGLLGL